MLRHYCGGEPRSCRATAAVAAAAPAAAAAVTAEDYARAEQFLSDGVANLVSSSGMISISDRGGISVNAKWLPDERLWYRNLLYFFAQPMLS